MENRDTERGWGMRPEEVRERECGKTGLETMEGIEMESLVVRVERNSEMMKGMGAKGRRGYM